MNIKKQKTQIDTLLISDIHLGSEISGAERAIEVINKYHFKRLILLGDTFDDMNLKRLNKTDWSFLSEIRKLTNPKNNIELVWIEGNHDLLFTEISLLFGITILESYEWINGNKKCVALHGHQFDSFLTENVIISEIASFIYKLFLKLDKKNHSFSRKIKMYSKNWLRLSKQIANLAIIYGVKNKANVVFCGHTHQQYFTSSNLVDYYNIGCFTDKPASYCIIHLDNIIELINN